MLCSSSKMVGRLEEEPAELSDGGAGGDGGGSTLMGGGGAWAAGEQVMGGRGAGGVVRGGGGGEGVAEGDSSCFTPGRAEGEDDGFCFPECGKKLEREKEAATAPHS